jgi:hypothetical protein
MYHPGRWFARFFVAGTLLPWLAFVAARAALGPIIESAAYVVPGVLMFAAVWNFIIACLVPPVVLMLVESTRHGPITWYRLNDEERELFAKAMYGTFCVLSAILFAMIWRESHLSLFPVLMTSFLPAIVASLSGVLVATIIVAGRHMLQRRNAKAPPASFSRRRPA